MRRLTRCVRGLWPLLVVALLCLPAAAPYLYGDATESGGLPRTNDALTHLYRAVELDRLVRMGILFPRWASDLAHGYGYPIFNYFAYFSHYLIVLFHLIGLPMLWAMRAAFVAALMGSGLGAFLLGRDLADGEEGTGLVAAVAYAYSPYLLYTAYVRGGLPENLALMFLPLALWGMRRALLAIHHKDPKTQSDTKEIWKYGVVTIIAIAGFIASHIGMALQYLPVIGVFGLYLIISRSRIRSDDFSHSPENATQVATTKRFRDVLIIRNWKLKIGDWKLDLSEVEGLGFGILSAIFAVALGLTAFLWLPSVVELGFVQFETAFARAGLVYGNNFFELGDLFAYPRLPVYTAVLNPPVVRALPLAALGLALLGLVRLRSFTLARRADSLFFFALFLLTAFLITTYSKPLWDFSPLLQRSTFPWRFLGPATLCLSLLAGLGLARWTTNDKRYALSISFVISFLMVSALPFLFPPREPAPESPTLADLARFEIPPLLVATTTTGEYTPMWVKEFPDTHDQQAALLEGREPERLVAPGATFEHLTAQPAHDVYGLTASDPVTAIYRSFYFPGWAVRLDGQPLTSRPTDPDGLITFDIPPGAHTLDIRFGDTPIRTTANVISIVSLAVLAYGLSRIAYRKMLTANVPRTTENYGVGIWPLGVGILILVFSFCSLFIASWFISKAGPPPAQYRLGFDFGGELTLYGYDRSGNTITLIWQAQHPIGVAYGLNLRLVDERGLIWSDTNIERPRDWRFFPGTDFWQPDQYIYDSYILKPVYGTPPGLYHLEAIAYRADTLQALSTQIIGDYVIDAPTNRAFVTPIANTGAAILIAATADRETAAPGNLYRLDLTWQGLAGPLKDETFCVLLMDERSGIIAHQLCELVSPLYPPRYWKAGDVLKQPLVFRLPANLNSGGYHWRLDTGLGEYELPVKLQINAPDRAFTVPPLGHPLKVEFDEPISLLGYNIATNGNQIAIELIWQAREEMSESYRVFLHLLDEKGNLVSQSDGEPAAWSRPTPGWLVGEVVTDARTLTAPGPGEYTLQAGLVTEAGGRLIMADWPEGAIRLGTVKVGP